MKLSFLFHLLSFLPLHNPPRYYHHYLISETKPLVRIKDLNNLRNDVKIDTLIYFKSHKSDPIDKNVNVYLPDLLKTNTVFVENFDTSKYHFQSFQEHRFSRHISYEDYCRLEKQIAIIVEQYLRDTNHNYAIILDDIFLQSCGISKYWTEKNYFLIRPQNDKNQNIDYIILNKINDFNFI